MSLPEKGIQVGERAPEFELPEVGGGVVALEELLGAPIVLVFYRGSW